MMRALGVKIKRVHPRESWFSRPQTVVDCVRRRTKSGQSKGGYDNSKATFIQTTLKIRIA